MLSCGVRYVTSWPVRGEQLGDRRGHVVAVRVVDDDARARRSRAPGDHLLGRQHVRKVSTCAGYRCLRHAVEAVRAQSAPVATTTISAPYEDSSAVRRVLGMSSTFRRRAICPVPVGDHAAPLAQPGQRRQPSSGARRARVPASTRWTRVACRACRAPSRTPCRPARRRRSRTSLPALAAGGTAPGCQPRRYSSPAVGFCVHQIGAAADLPTRDADVAADALADVVESALLDLLRQERIGDRRPRGADDVALAATGWPRPSCRDR